ncbi:unnamed protein product [Brachionus calyciflorus]|uniref:Uncharacterized protein n=1 Tax=Brachionus calyciflorus TaxID=104777 RepID=A0A814LLU6_9BILA|nr:unnamed protein product [Brachionus calyciflorus]
MDYRQLLAEQSLRKHQLNNKLATEKIEFLKEQRRILSDFNKTQDDEREAFRRQNEEEKLEWMKTKKKSSSEKNNSKESKQSTLKSINQPLIDSFTSNKKQVQMQSVELKTEESRPKTLKLNEKQKELCSRIEIKKRKLDSGINFQMIKNKKINSDKENSFLGKFSFLNKKINSGCRELEKKNKDFPLKISEPALIVISGSDCENENEVKKQMETHSDKIVDNKDQSESREELGFGLTNINQLNNSQDEICKLINEMTNQIQNDIIMN